MNESFEECLKLLKGGADEEKIAGLLIMAKLLENNSDLDKDMVVSSVVEATGVEFFRRLIAIDNQGQLICHIKRKSII